MTFQALNLKLSKPNRKNSRAAIVCLLFLRFTTDAELLVKFLFVNISLAFSPEGELVGKDIWLRLLEDIGREDLKANVKNLWDQKGG